MYLDDELLPISGLQHLVFCPRQCALIHVERLWVENTLTALGRVVHNNAHSTGNEKRRNKVKSKSLRISSYEYGIYGETDIVEFNNEKILVVEYKRGKPKNHDADKIQLCAQILCLEEMMNVSIKKSFLFYDKIKRRESVLIDTSLREKTLEAIESFHIMIREKYTPQALYKPSCKSCSLIEICCPKLPKTKKVKDYIGKMINSVLDEKL